MSTEVKIVYADVENQLMEITNTMEALNPKSESPITGNTLAVVSRLTTLSTQLEQLLTKFQAVLSTNVQTTASLVSFMKESDEKISSAMQCTIPGPKQVSQ